MDHSSILLEKERLICSYSLLEKKKISTDRKLIVAEKKIASLQDMIAQFQNKTIDLLEKLQLREEVDINQTLIDKIILHKFQSILEDLRKLDNQSHHLINDSNPLVNKKQVYEALLAQSEMVRQVSQCTSTTISTERARCASLSLAADQSEEKVEKLEKELKEIKHKYELSENLRNILSEQLESTLEKSQPILGNNASLDSLCLAPQKEIFSLQRIILELKQIIEESKKEIITLSNDRDALRLRLQSLHDQHTEEIRTITNGPWKLFINEQKKYWIKLQAAADALLEKEEK